MNTPQVDDLVLFLGQMAGALVAIIAVITVLYKMFTREIKEDLAEIKKELHPNGGSSMRDAINRLEQGHRHIDSEMDEIASDVKEIRNKVDDHINWHLDHQ